MTANKHRAATDALITATNALDVEAALALFAQKAVIRDPGAGGDLEGATGIRDYIERFFVGYHTVTRFLSIKSLGPNASGVRVDFTGDFGHEIGLLDIHTDASGLIISIDAELE